MRICPNCQSWKVQQSEENVLKYYRCPNCGWMGITHVTPGMQLRFLHRSYWMPVIFFLLIGGGHLIFTLITPSEYFSFLDKAHLFSEKSLVPGEIEPKSLTTEAPSILMPLAQAVPSLPVVSSEGVGSVSQHQPDKYQVVANSDSKLYHLPGMKYYNNIANYHRVTFPTEEAAQQAGYRKAPK